MKWTLDKAEQLLNEYFDQFPWHESEKNPMIIVIDKSWVYEWGIVPKYGYKKFLESEDEENFSVGLKPLILDVKKWMVIPVSGWPLVTRESAVSDYIASNQYNDKRIPMP